MGRGGRDTVRACKPLNRNEAGPVNLFSTAVTGGHDSAVGAKLCLRLRATSLVFDSKP